MKYYFFINPIAGRGKVRSFLEKRIEKAAKSTGLNPTIVLTKEAGSLEEQARKLAKSLDGEEARFYACGGDGTASEVVNGIAGYPNVACGIVPVGSGNDTVRNFGTIRDFFNIEAQLTGPTIPIDLISFDANMNGEEVQRYCLNMINIGLDCNVVANVEWLRKKPLIYGSGAYLTSVFYTLIKKEGAALKIHGEGLDREGPLLLCAIANGKTCGGGIKAAPQATMDDGYFDVTLCKNICRRTFLRHFNKYRKGTHLQDKGAMQFIDVYRLKELSIEPYGAEEIVFCNDGEILTTKYLRLRISPKKINMVVPWV